MLTKIIKYWYNTCYKLQQVNLTARVRMIYALKKAKQSEVDILVWFWVLFPYREHKPNPFILYSDRKNLFVLQAKTRCELLQFWVLLDVPRKEQL